MTPSGGPPTDWPDAAIGDRVRVLRTNRGWTQRQLAERLRERGWEIDPTGVTRLEQGSRVLQVRQLFTLASVLGVDITWLLPGDPSGLAGRRADIETRLREARSALLGALGSLDRLQNFIGSPGGSGIAAEAGVPNDLRDLIRQLAVASRADAWHPVRPGTDNAKDARERVALYRELLADLISDLVALDEEAQHGERAEAS